MPRKTFYILIVTIVIIILGFVFWYFFLNTSPISQNQNSQTGQSNGFAPFGKTDNNQQGNSVSGNGNSNQNSPTEVKIPALRLLSATPVGGYGASTTASTTIIDWVDRGRGNVLQTTEDSAQISTLSNTLLPRVYESTWNTSLSAFIGSILSDDDTSLSTVYATLTKQATSTSSITPYTLHGKSFPSTIVTYASSPKKDKVFLFSIENGQGVGYVAPFGGGTATQIFSTPVTQVNVEWPEENTIAITTKGSATADGFLYFINPKTGVWKKILGPYLGLSTRVSHDAKYVIASISDGATGVLTSIYSVSSTTGTDAIVRTLADKCVWGNFYKDLIYCAVPFQPVSGTYPDDWYKGTLSTVDKIWQLNAQTGEIHLISSVFSEAKRSIDAFNLGLDDKDSYLFFINKNDLSLWSLDLVNSK